MGKTRKPAAAPPKPFHVRVTDCKTALLYSDLAPLAANALSTGKWDYEAIWAHVVEQPTADKFNLLTYYHGNDNHVKVDESGACVDPDWRSFGKGFACTSNFCEFKKSAGQFLQPLVLVIEDVNPADQHTTSVGNLKDTSAYGSCVDDCLDILSKLPKNDTCQPDVPFLGKRPLINYLDSKPTLSSITRLCMSGHSGGGKPLAPTAVSTLGQTAKVADLWLYDCTYADWGQIEYPLFCQRRSTQMGNGPDKSRLVAIVTPGDTDRHLKDIIASIKKLGLAVNEELDYVNTTDKVKKDKGLDCTSSDAAHIEQVLRCNPIVIIRVPAVHRNGQAWHSQIPRDFLPLLLKTAGQTCPSK